MSGHLYSEPDFELQFSGKVGYAEDYLTADPGSDHIARPACVGTIFPDDGASPFLFRIGGIDTSSAEAAAIFTGKSRGVAVPYGYSYSVWVPTFYGGYSALQVRRPKYNPFPRRHASARYWCLTQMDCILTSI